MQLQQSLTSPVSRHPTIPRVYTAAWLSNNRVYFQSTAGKRTAPLPYVMSCVKNLTLPWWSTTTHTHTHCC